MDAPSSLWIVLDPKAGPEFATAWREGAHEHIKDCLDGGTNEAARWVVREYVPIAEVERLRAEVEALRADALRFAWFSDHGVGVDMFLDAPKRVLLWTHDGMFNAWTFAEAIDAAWAAQRWRGWLSNTRST